MSFYILTIRTLFLVGYLAILVLEVTKSLELPHAKVGVPCTVYSFHVSSQSWEIGSPSPLSGGAGRMKLFCVVPAFGHIPSDPFIHLEGSST